MSHLVAAQDLFLTISDACEENETLSGLLFYPWGMHNHEHYWHARSHTTGKGVFLYRSTCDKYTFIMDFASPESEPMHCQPHGFARLKVTKESWYSVGPGEWETPCGTRTFDLALRSFELANDGACQLSHSYRLYQKGLAGNGLPYYRTENPQDPEDPYFLYFDPSCAGSTTSGTPRWVLDSDWQFDPTRSMDLDNDGDCSYQGRVDQGSSIYPPMGSAPWNMQCNGRTWENYDMEVRNLREAPAELPRPGVMDGTSWQAWHFSYQGVVGTGLGPGRLSHGSFGALSELPHDPAVGRDVFDGHRHGASLRGGFYGAAPGKDGGMELHFQRPTRLKRLLASCIHGDAEPAQNPWLAREGLCWGAGAYNVTALEARFWDGSDWRLALSSRIDKEGDLELEVLTQAFARSWRVLAPFYSSAHPGGEALRLAELSLTDAEQAAVKRRRLSNGEGNVPAGTECVLPFWYDGSYRQDCFQGWCSTGSVNFEDRGKWGGCTAPKACPKSLSLGYVVVEIFAEQSKLSTQCMDTEPVNCMHGEGLWPGVKHRYEPDSDLQFDCGPGRSNEMDADISNPEDGLVCIRRLREIPCGFSTKCKRIFPKCKRGDEVLTPAGPARVESVVTKDRKVRVGTGVSWNWEEVWKGNERCAPDDPGPYVRSGVYNGRVFYQRGTHYIYFHSGGYWALGYGLGVGVDMFATTSGPCPTDARGWQVWWDGAWQSASKHAPFELHVASFKARNFPEELDLTWQKYGHTRDGRPAFKAWSDFDQDFKYMYYDSDCTRSLRRRSIRRRARGRWMIGAPPGPDLKRTRELYWDQQCPARGAYITEERTPPLDHRDWYFPYLSSFRNASFDMDVEDLVVADGCPEELTGNGMAYRGCQNHTRSGRPCQPWAAQWPHNHSTLPESFLHAHLHENHCRNPDGDESIWCYTADPETRWEYCRPLHAACPSTLSVDGVAFAESSASEGRPEYASESGGRLFYSEGAWHLNGTAVAASLRSEALCPPLFGWGVNVSEVQPCPTVLEVSAGARDLGAFQKAGQLHSRPLYRSVFEDLCLSSNSEGRFILGTCSLNESLALARAAEPGARCPTMVTAWEGAAGVQVEAVPPCPERLSVSVNTGAARVYDGLYKRDGSQNGQPLYHREDGMYLYFDNNGTWSFGMNVWVLGSSPLRSRSLVECPSRGHWELEGFLGDIATVLLIRDAGPYLAAETCTATFSDMQGVLLEETLIEASGEAELNSECCRRCRRNPACQFWVREASICWLKREPHSPSWDSGRQGGLVTAGPQFCADEGELCLCSGTIYLGAKYRTEDHMRANLDDMIRMEHSQLPVSKGATACNEATFGTSLSQLAGKEKQCVCVPERQVACGSTFAGEVGCAMLGSFDYGLCEPGDLDFMVENRSVILKVAYRHTGSFGLPCEVLGSTVPDVAWSGSGLVSCDYYLQNPYATRKLDLTGCGACLVPSLRLAVWTDCTPESWRADGALCHYKPIRSTVQCSGKLQWLCRAGEWQQMGSCEEDCPVPELRGVSWDSPQCVGRVATQTSCGIASISPAYHCSGQVLKFVVDSGLDGSYAPVRWDPGFRTSILPGSCSLGDSLRSGEFRMKFSYASDHILLEEVHSLPWVQETIFCTLKRELRSRCSSGTWLPPLPECYERQVLFGKLGLADDRTSASLTRGLRQLSPGPQGGVLALTRDGAVVQWPATQTFERVRQELTQGVLGLADATQSWDGEVAMFAAWKGSGDVVLWGEVPQTEDSSLFSQQLSDIRSVVKNKYGMAALTGKGAVLAWTSQGKQVEDASSNGFLQRDVVKLLAASNFFVAQKLNGWMMAWNVFQEEPGVLGWRPPSLCSTCGSNLVVQLASLVIKIVCTLGASQTHLALLEDGSIFTWGSYSESFTLPTTLQQDVQLGDVASRTEVEDACVKVKDVAATSNAFCLLQRCGQVRCWDATGSSPGEFPSVQEQLGAVAALSSAGRHGFCSLDFNSVVSCWRTDPSKQEAIWQNGQPLSGVAKMLPALNGLALLKRSGKLLILGSHSQAHEDPGAMESSIAFMQDGIFDVVHSGGGRGGGNSFVGLKAHCPMPAGIPHAEVQSCKEHFVAPGGTASDSPPGVCTPNCQPGSSPTALALFCAFPDKSENETSNMNENDAGVMLTEDLWNESTWPDNGTTVTTTSSATDDSDLNSWLEPLILTPPQFSCLLDCKAPAVPFAPIPSCAGGSAVASMGAWDLSFQKQHTGVCTPLCLEGYVPSVDELICRDGKLDPPSWTCYPKCNAPTGIKDSASPTCEEGATIPVGGSCTPLCMPGFQPSVTELGCAAGVLSPAEFTCYGSAEAFEMVDQDMDAGFIGGTATWRAPAAVDFAVQHQVWLSAGGKNLLLAENLSTDTLAFDVPMGTRFEEEDSLLLCTDYGTAVLCAETRPIDVNGQASATSFIDVDPDADEIAGLVSWRASEQESLVRYYVVYLRSSSAVQRELGKVHPNTTSFWIPEDTPCSLVGGDFTHIRVSIENLAGYQQKLAGEVAFQDFFRSIAPASFSDSNWRQGVVGGSITWTPLEDASGLRSIKLEKLTLQREVMKMANDIPLFHDSYAVANLSFQPGSSFRVSLRSQGGLFGGEASCAVEDNFLLPATAVTCMAGQPCGVDLVGSGLKNGSWLAPMGDCAAPAFLPEKEAQTGVTAGDGSSASFQGLEGLAAGNYKLCWCAQDCLSESRYSFEAGSLEVQGPFQGSWACVRGQHCLLKVRGLQLSQEAFFFRVQIACGAEAMRLSARNGEGLAELRGRGDSLDADLGSRDEQDVLSCQPRVYRVCWCTERGLAPGVCESPANFKDIGGLAVQGPSPGHELVCRSGQPCSGFQVQGLALAPSDLVVVSKKCSDSLPVPGLPGNGVAVALLSAGRSDTVEFAFDAEGEGAGRFEAVAGFYRLCFCRPGNSFGCRATEEGLQGFFASVGNMVLRGPWRSQSYVCLVGALCEVRDMQGTLLSNGDRLRILGACGQGAALDGLPAASAAASHEGGAFNLGFLRHNETLLYPEAPRLCWCPGDGLHACNEPAHFRTDAGKLEVLCPLGYYKAFARTMRRLWSCVVCTRGYYCNEPPLGRKTKCPQLQTTLHPGAQSQGDCQCQAGAYYDLGRGFCQQCPAGRFKGTIGSESSCPSECPNATTMTTPPGAVSAAQCHCRQGFLQDSSQDGFHCVPEGALLSQRHSSLKSTNVTVLRGELRLEVESLEDEDALREKARSALSTSFGMSLTDIDLNMTAAARRLQEQQAPAIKVHYAARFKSLEEAEAAQDSFVLGELQELLSMQIQGLMDVVMVQPALVAIVALTCPQGKAFLPGVRATSIAECECAWGFEPESGSSAAGRCQKCAKGWLKSSVGNLPCSRCPPVQGDDAVSQTTLSDGAEYLSDCVCPPGWYGLSQGACQPCGVGFYCPGGSQRHHCPSGSNTTGTDTASEEGCQCKAGYEPSLRDGCQPCKPGYYKSVAGDSQCGQTCPVFSSSKPGAVDASDCFCESGYFYSASKQSCELCADEGLFCAGGFVDGSSKIHREPESRPGFYMVLSSTTVRCQVQISNKTGGQDYSACLGGWNRSATRANEDDKLSSAVCEIGHVGLACGACAYGWARDTNAVECQSCDGLAGDGALIQMMMFGSLVKASGTMVIACLAIAEANNVRKLDAMLIRIFTQWMGVMSVLATLDMSQVEIFEWSKRQVETLARKEANDPETLQGVLDFKFPWPEFWNGVAKVIYKFRGYAPALLARQQALQCILMRQQMDELNLQLGNGLLWLLQPLVDCLWILLLLVVVAKVGYPVKLRLGTSSNLGRSSAKALTRLGLPAAFAQELSEKMKEDEMLLLLEGPQHWIKDLDNLVELFGEGRARRAVAAHVLKKAAPHPALTEEGVRDFFSVCDRDCLALGCSEAKAVWRALEQRDVVWQPALAKARLLQDARSLAGRDNAMLLCLLQSCLARQDTSSPSEHLSTMGQVMAGLEDSCLLAIHSLALLRRGAPKRLVVALRCLPQLPQGLRAGLKATAAAALQGDAEASLRAVMEAPGLQEAAKEAALVFAGLPKRHAFWAAQVLETENLAKLSGNSSGANAWRELEGLLEGEALTGLAAKLLSEQILDMGAEPCLAAAAAMAVLAKGIEPGFSELLAQILGGDAGQQASSAWASRAGSTHQGDIISGYKDIFQHLGLGCICSQLLRPALRRTLFSCGTPLKLVDAACTALSYEALSGCRREAGCLLRAASTEESLTSVCCMLTAIGVVEDLHEDFVRPCVRNRLLDTGISAKAACAAAAGLDVDEKHGAVARLLFGKPLLKDLRAIAAGENVLLAAAQRKFQQLGADCLAASRLVAALGPEESPELERLVFGDGELSLLLTVLQEQDSPTEATFSQSRSAETLLKSFLQPALFERMVAMGVSRMLAALMGSALAPAERPAWDAEDRVQELQTLVFAVVEGSFDLFCLQALVKGLGVCDFEKVLQSALMQLLSDLKVPPELLPKVKQQVFTAEDLPLLQRLLLQGCGPGDRLQALLELLAPLCEKPFRALRPALSCNLAALGGKNGRLSEMEQLQSTLATEIAYKLSEEMVQELMPSLQRLLLPGKGEPCMEALERVCGRMGMEDKMLQLLHCALCRRLGLLAADSVDVAQVVECCRQLPSTVEAILFGGSGSFTEAVVNVCSLLQVDAADKVFRPMVEQRFWGMDVRRIEHVLQFLGSDSLPLGVVEGLVASGAVSTVSALDQVDALQLPSDGESKSSSRKDCDEALVMEVFLAKLLLLGVNVHNSLLPELKRHEASPGFALHLRAVTEELLRGDRDRNLGVLEGLFEVMGLAQSLRSQTLADMVHRRFLRLEAPRELLEDMYLVLTRENIGYLRPAISHFIFGEEGVLAVLTDLGEEMGMMDVEGQLLLPALVTCLQKMGVSSERIETAVDLFSKSELEDVLPALELLLLRQKQAPNECDLQAALSTFGIPEGAARHSSWGDRLSVGSVVVHINEAIGIKQYPVFKLLTDTSWSSIIRQSVPLLLIMLYDIWMPTSIRMLEALSCERFFLETGLSSRWLGNTMEDCVPPTSPRPYLAFIGLGLWSSGYLIGLYFSIARHKQELMKPWARRQFGYFINGFEAGYWWWELLVKRGDTLVILIITHTNFVTDHRAKLILYMAQAGIFWAVHNACRPYDNRENQLLDRFDGMFLRARFLTVFVMVMLLVFADLVPRLFIAVLAATLLAVNIHCIFCFTLMFGSEMVANLFQQQPERDASGKKVRTALPKKLRGLVKNRLLRKVLGAIFRAVTLAFDVINTVRQAMKEQAPRLHWQGISMPIRVVNAETSTANFEGSEGEFQGLRKVSSMLWAPLRRLIGAFYGLQEEQQKGFFASSVGKVCHHLLTNARFQHLAGGQFLDTICVLTLALQRMRTDSGEEMDRSLEAVEESVYKVLLSIDAKEQQLDEDELFGDGDPSSSIRLTGAVRHVTRRGTIAPQASTTIHSLDHADRKLCFSAEELNQTVMYLSSLDEQDCQRVCALVYKRLQRHNPCNKQIIAQELKLSSMTRRGGTKRERRTSESI